MNKKSDIKRKNERIIIKINNKIIKSEDIKLGNDEIELLKKVLFNNKPSLCQTCNARVCLANKKKLTGPILEGITVDDTSLITECANNRNRKIK